MSENSDSWLLAAFADPARELWGLIGGGPERHVAVGRLQSPATGSTGAAPAPRWNPASELALSPDSLSGPVSASADAADALRLQRIGGIPDPDGGSAALDVPAVVFAGPRLAKLDSIRILAAWFPDDRAIALSAVRPRGGHADKDVVSVLVTGAGAVPTDPVAPDEPEPLQVFDPRLSTTYDRHGDPLRAGLELWLGPDEDSDQRPLRMSCETTGDRVGSEFDNLRLEAYPQLCHSRGESGVGIYALLRPR